MTVLWRGINKVTEECGELVLENGKLAAFPEGPHPDGRGPVIGRVADEMADVTAAITWFCSRNGIRLDQERVQRKVALFQSWDESEGMSGVVPAHQQLNDPEELGVCVACRSPNDDPTSTTCRKCSSALEANTEFASLRVAHRKVVKMLEDGVEADECIMAVVLQLPRWWEREPVVIASPPEHDRLSRALIVQRDSVGVLLEYDGPDISFEVEAGFTDLDDLGLEDALPGLWVWEGRYVARSDDPGDDSGTEPEGRFRRLTEQEFSAFKSGVPLWRSLP